MRIKQYEVWLADLNPKIGTEPGKTRPVAVIQTNLLNEFHPSTLICPVTTKVNKEVELLRVHLKKGQLNNASDILVDQIRAIDNRRFKKKLSVLTKEQIHTLKNNIRIVLDI
jgi:mRNA interferase MazF